MNKLVIIVIIILVVLGFGFVCFYNISSHPKNIEKTVTVNPTAKMPETNPFKTKVNPVEGYTNPFSK